MKVEVIRAWPRRFERIELEVPATCTVGEALALTGIAADDVGPLAVFGVRADTRTVLAEGDRIEMLRPLQVDPKQARRKRAEARPLPRR